MASGINGSERVLAFDIYGTLLDTGSMYARIQAETGLEKEHAVGLSQLWRRYQLEYTWRLNSMGLFEPFDVVTARSLRHAAAEYGVDLNDGAISVLMEAYMRLPPFADAIPALVTLNAQPDLKIVVLSNGSEKMVSTALKAALPKSMICPPIYLTEAIQRYKPAPEVYHELRQSLEKPMHEALSPVDTDIWLVSGNPFDVTGARAAGLGAVWVDRAGTGWLDQLPLDNFKLGPLKIVRGLGEIASFFSSSS